MIRRSCLRESGKDGVAVDVWESVKEVVPWIQVSIHDEEIH